VSRLLHHHHHHPQTSTLATRATASWRTWRCTSSSRCACVCAGAGVFWFYAGVRSGDEGCDIGIWGMEGGGKDVSRVRESRSTCAMQGARDSRTRTPPLLRVRRPSWALPLPEHAEARRPAALPMGPGRCCGNVVVDCGRPGRHHARNPTDAAAMKRACPPPLLLPLFLPRPPPPPPRPASFTAAPPLPVQTAIGMLLRPFSQEDEEAYAEGLPEPMYPGG
jgi:hypothetical protein